MSSPSPMESTLAAAFAAAFWWTRPWRNRHSGFAGFIVAVGFGVMAVAAEVVIAVLEDGLTPRGLLERSAALAVAATLAYRLYFGDGCDGSAGVAGTATQHPESHQR